MTKTFTCKELGGTCDETFSGNSLMEIVDQGMPHMMSDDAHKESIMQMESRTGENKEAWMARMQKEFEEKLGDQ